MAIRVIHWGTGATGRLALGAILERPGLELVGQYVWNAEKAGRDAGELIGRPAVGVIATQDIDALIALRPDVLTYFGNGVRDRQQTARDIARFLQSGINVVTSSLPQLIHPDCGEPDLREIVEAACEEGGATLFASGIDPGFATSHLAVTAYCVAHRVDRVRLQEFADYGVYPDEQTGRYLWGFGLPLDAETVVSSGAFLKSAWTGTLEANARALGWTIESYRTTCVTAPARKDHETAIGSIEKGTTSAVWFQLIATVDGAEKLILEHVNWIDVDDVPADWPVPPTFRGEPSGVSYRQVIEGEPSYDLELQMKDSDNGLLMTAMHPVNAIPLTIAAKPGVIDQTGLAPFGPGDATSRLGAVFN
ncbi:hypothetical protein [Novosphingobium pentaromativorans]|uniref:Dihydrodipicolinate reductase n=1 Tax=Novosphingobium pentaromativorans US6-1 TaxID=1088721 RepID=G6EAT3_9SPHN|nr:hypothetical protein [Novosphingobium pentaromativorans]AIT80577.1 hypothetical protein JI59_12760 [Novosphingobium pentaromativorans US6-1]EHJ61720.1 hypothetical protein NSU_1481 [Novosphingobium pentaromativorans US6-1]